MDNQFTDQMQKLMEQIAWYKEKLRKMNAAQLSEEFNGVLNAWAEEWLDDSEFGYDFEEEDFEDEDFDDEDFEDVESGDADFDDDDDDFDDLEELSMDFLKGLGEEFPELMDEALEQIADMVKIEKVISVLQELDPSWDPAKAAEDKDAYEMYLEEKMWMEEEE